MRMKAEIVRLGAHEWLVRPLTISQVQSIEPVLLESGATSRGNVAAALSILRVALLRDHPGAVESLEEIEAGASEISLAMATVLRLGGFLPLPPGGSDAPGEAEAG